MKILTYILFCICLIFLCCHKKSDDPASAVTPPTSTTHDTGLVCGSLPIPPPPFSWQDTLNDEDKNINFFTYDPTNPDRLIYVANGNIFGGYHKLFSYNIPTKQSLLLGTNLAYLPDVNSEGWVLFSDFNSDMWKIKLNGDSLKQMSNNQISDNPRWNYTGNSIYFFQKAKDNVSAQIIRISKDGIFESFLFNDLPYFVCFHKSEKIIYAKNKVNNTVTLIIKDYENPKETDFLTDAKESAPGQFNFDNMCLDKNDENLYWSNSNGIFSCNLNTHKIDTLFRNCENMIYTNPISSFKDNELYYTMHIKKPLAVYKLLHIYKPMEMNLLSKQSSEVNIFP